MATDGGQLKLVNFSSIDGLELPIHPITVLIGPQSVGKSVTAKALYCLKSLIWEVLSAAFDRSNSASLDDRLSTWFNRLMPNPSHKGGRSSAEWYVKDEMLGFSSNDPAKGEWKVSLPPAVRELFDKVSSAARKEASLEGDSPPGDESLKRELEREFVRGIVEILGEGACFRTRFIPAGRAFYAQVEKDPASFFESATLDPFVSEFGKFWAGIKGGRFNPTHQKARFRKEADALMEDLLSGRFVRDQGQDTIHVRDGRKVPAKLWSSGQQEVLPLAYVLALYAGYSFSPKPGRMLFVEEPEAHLFPASQYAALELLSSAYNACNGRLQFFITTHSPYVLSTLNVLIKAGQLYASNHLRNKAVIEKTVSSLRALPPRVVGAYRMDGKSCESIIDTETHLINGSAIDQVSSDIATRFDELIELE